MSLRTGYRLGSLLIFVTCALLAGCGPRMVQVKGKVTASGKPLKKDAWEIIQVVFIPQPEVEDKPSQMYAAQLEGSSFQILGRRNRGIPAGKYRVSVMFTGGRRSGKKTENLATSSVAVIRDVNGKDEIVIDVDKPQ